MTFQGLQTPETLPINVVLSRDGSRTYVVSAGPQAANSMGQLQVFDSPAEPPSMVIPLDVGFPNGARLSPDGTRLYIAVSKFSSFTTSTGIDRIDILDTTTNVLLPSLIVDANDSAPGSGPTAIVLTPDSKKLYVTKRIVGLVDLFDLSDPEHPAFRLAFAAGAQPIGIDISPDGSQVYCIDRQTAVITVISTVDDLVIDSVPSSLPPSASESWIRLSRDGKRAYACTSTAGTIAVMDTDPGSPTYHTEIAMLSTCSSGLGQIEIAPSGDFAVIASLENPGRVLFLDTNVSSPHFQEVRRSIGFNGLLFGVACIEAGLTGMAIITNAVCPDPGGCVAVMRW